MKINMLWLLIGWKSRGYNVAVLQVTHCSATDVADKRPLPCS